MPKELVDSDLITGIQIYMDFPPQSVRLFTDDLTKDYFSPMSKARGTYWYGIFQGTNQSSLFCPEFYLGEREKESYGDMAYITSTTFYYQGEARQAYIALIHFVQPPAQYAERQPDDRWKCFLYH